jgi:phospholipid/cholesterol/gamma-HCH transport system substrate-binding protein
MFLIVVCCENARNIDNQRQRTMNRHERGLEFKVGAFVFVGLAMLGALVVQFGRLGEGFKHYYEVTVRFTDASGLLKGSDVLLAGAKIGHVSGGPRLARQGNGVVVPLRIYDYVNIPAESKFSIGSSGLLGDRFVNVTMPPGQPRAFLPRGASISGAREAGINDLTREGGALVNDLRAAVRDIDTTFTRLNEQALSQSNIDNLNSSIAHLNEATAAFADSSKKLGGTVEKADATLDSTKQAVDSLQRTISEARKVFQSATQGKGLLATLLSNEQLATDLRALIQNLRAHGVLFYRDTASKVDTNTAAQTKRAEPRTR